MWSITPCFLSAYSKELWSPSFLFPGFTLSFSHRLFFMINKINAVFSLTLLQWSAARFSLLPLACPVTGCSLGLCLLWWLRWAWIFWFLLQCLHCPHAALLGIHLNPVRYLSPVCWVKVVILPCCTSFPIDCWQILLLWLSCVYPVCSIPLTCIISINFFRALSALPIAPSFVSAYPTGPEQRQWRCLWWPSFHCKLYPDVSVLP